MGVEVNEEEGMALTKIRFTKKQREILDPLFDRLDVEIKKGRGVGAVFFQMWRMGKTGYAEGMYIPAEFAKQIRPLVLEARREEEW